MRALLLTAALALAACTQEPAAPAADPAQSGAPSLTAAALPQTDGAGNRFEALTQDEENWCASDGAWCLQAIEGTPVRVVGGGIVITLPPPGAAWPFLIRTGEASVLAGLVESEQQMYSGGDGNGSVLSLYEVTARGATKVATIPLSGGASVRACFDEDDMRQRAEACHDEYAFVTRLSLDETVTSGSPRIVLETAAASFPGRVTRQADSLEAAPLTEADLVWASDETCTFRRVFTRGADGQYTPDTPLPACEDYLQP
jgi:hypothetical protein